MAAAGRAAVLRLIPRQTVREANVLLARRRPCIGSCAPADVRGKQTLSARLDELGTKWNSLSGYDAIERLRGRVAHLERGLHDAQKDLQSKRQAYVASVSERSASQRELSDLLSRKASWSESDLSKYTKLLHAEHSQSKLEADREKAYEEAEEALQRAFDDFMGAVTQRYHEEQVWSDRIRGISTWGSVSIAVLNALVFMLAIFLVEPYKRRKLAQTLEKRLLEGEAQNTAQLVAALAQLDERLSSLQHPGGEPVTSGTAELPTREEKSRPEPIARHDLGTAVAAGIAVALLGRAVS